MNETEIMEEGTPAAITNGQAEKPKDPDLCLCFPLSKWNASLQLIGTGTRASNEDEALIIGGVILREMKEQLQKQLKDQLEE